MNTLVETLPGLLRRLTLHIPAQQVQSAYDQRLEQLAHSSDVRIDGFRPQKISKRVMQQRYGRSIYEKFIQELINDNLRQAIIQERLNIIYSPIIISAKTELGADIEIVSEFEIFPEINLVEPQNNLKKIIAVIKPADLTVLIEKLLYKHADWINVDRAAQIGDHLLLRYHPVTTEIASHNIQELSIFLGANLISTELEAELVNMQIGEIKSIHLKAEKHLAAHSPLAAGGHYQIEILAIQEKILPVLDDQLAIKMGFKDGVNNMHQELTEILLQLTVEPLEKIKQWQILDHFLLINSAILLPKRLIELEYDMMNSRYQQKNIEVTAELAEKFKAIAEQRVKLMLLINRYVTQHNIQLDLTRLQKIHPELLKLAQAQQRTSNEESALQQAKIQVMVEQVIEHLTPKTFIETEIETAETVEKMGYQEILDLYQQLSLKWNTE